MSDFNDRPQFQPPQFQPPGSPQGQPFGAPTPSFEAGPPTVPLEVGPPTTPIEVTPPPSAKKRGKGVIIGAAVAVVALVGAGVFALTQIGGNDAKGGAASPTEAGENLVKALNDEDILGAVDLLLPGERETFRQPMIDVVDNLKRLDVLGDDADPSKVSGIDIELADAKVVADTPSAPDITTIRISATDHSTVNGEALPVGDIIIDEALGGKRPSNTTEASNSKGSVALTTVEKDGRWYVSAVLLAGRARPHRRRRRAGAGQGRRPRRRGRAGPGGRPDDRRIDRAGLHHDDRWAQPERGGGAAALRAAVPRPGRRAGEGCGRGGHVRRRRLQRQRFGQPPPGDHLGVRADARRRRRERLGAGQGRLRGGHHPGRLVRLVQGRRRHHQGARGCRRRATTCPRRCRA